MLLEKDLTAIEENRGVDGGLAGVGRCRQRDASDQRGGQVTRGLGEFIDGLAAAGEKARFLKKVGGRVSADGQLGEDGEPRAKVGGATGNRKNLFKIAGEIPDRGVDLGQCDLHIFQFNAEGTEKGPGQD